ncbi:MAG: hypothetical protein M3O50_20650, partial [Myxococcota bacterium]|nr:hypothetical protein [Myxococcota bacterium]
ATPDPAPDPPLAAASGPVPGDPPPEPPLDPEAAIPLEAAPEPEATGGALRESDAPQPTARHASVTTVTAVTTA